ncbi:hypothetical protein RB199_18185 [Streptomyces libani]
MTGTAPWPEGVTATIVVSSRTVKLAAGRGPKLTAVARLKLRPMMVTRVPPL